MKNLFLAGLFLFSLGFANAQGNKAFAKSQVMPTSTLVKELKSSKKQKPLVLDIGFLGKIEDAVKLAPASTEAGINKLKAYLKNVPKDREIVIYCGCCPMDKCPNIHPAMNLLQKEGYKNVKVLGLTHNLKTEWIDKGYPMEK